MQFGDSMLPTGAFAFSGALEAAVQKGAVHDVPTLQQYVVSALRQSATGDAVGLDRALRRLCADPVSMGAPVSDAALARLRSIDLALYRRKLPEEFRDMMTRTGRKLAELAASEEPVAPCLNVEAAQASDIERIPADEKNFRFLFNEDAMATEKTAEGIRKFSADIRKLESLLASML